MFLSKPQKKRRGTVAILVALSLVLLMGVLALLLDGGMLRDNRRQIQTVADMAALAAVTELFSDYATAQGQDPNGTARQSALANAASNGFNNDGKKNTVTVNLYPSAYQGGAWKGQTIPQGYAEVIISYEQPAYFSNVWGTTTTQVSARAVARGTWQQASAGIHVLGNSGTTVSTQGSPSVQTDGQMVTNSTDNNARDNGGGNFQATQFFFSDGGADDDSYRNVNTGSTDSSIINHSVPATPDPLAVLPTPSQPRNACTPDGNQACNLNWSGDDSYGAKNGQLTLSPGTYQGGICATNGSVVLQPGIYYLTGSGLSLSGNASICVSGPSCSDTGSGALIYYTPGSGSSGGWNGGNYWNQGNAGSAPRSWQAMLLVALLGDGSGAGGAGGCCMCSSTCGSVSLTPPSCGTYQGVTCFQDRSCSGTNNITCNGNMNIKGTIYTPCGTVAITANCQDKGANGAPKDACGSQIITNSISVAGAGSFSVAGGSGTPVRLIQLLE